MTQHSEERLAATRSPASERAGARILPFERPQSDLQRAIQVRAQEAIDRAREREREVRRPQPLKWLTIVAVASIPVFLMFGAVDGFLRVFHRVMETTYGSAPASTSQPAVEPAPRVQPGVVLLESYERAPADAAAVTGSPAAPGTESRR